LANQLSTYQPIRQVTYSRFVPGDPIGAAKMTRIPGNATQIGFDYNGVNENFIPLFGLKLLSGRNFISDDRSDAIIISEVAAHRWGFESPAAAIGAKLEVDEGFGQAKWLNVEVIGVLADYRTYPFFETAESASGFKNEYESRGLLLTYKNKTFSDFLPERLAIKVSKADLNESIVFAEKEFKALFPGEVFSWFFLNESINKIYSNEKLLRNQILLFVGLAVVIACIGFLGMITHKVISKTKEIGIRKVLGASSAHISKVILKSSFFQFGISVVIGVPVAWYLGELYLQKFSERVVLQWWHYVLPVLILLFILFSTVATLVWKAAKSNPVEALKYE
jgi:putative ABC transport system permease protein